MLMSASLITRPNSEVEQYLFSLVFTYYTHDQSVIIFVNNSAFSGGALCLSLSMELKNWQ